VTATGNPAPAVKLSKQVSREAHTRSAWCFKGSFPWLASAQIWSILCVDCHLSVRST
jgi:hypothetical protein